MGEILHMSIIPEPRYWPREAKKVSKGIPNKSERKRN
jgi:hypothetical protein